MFAAQFPRSARADDAQRYVAGYHFEEEDWDLAIDRYQILYREYPQSEWRQLAEFRIGECYLHMSYGPDYDRTLLLRAREIFRGYLARYPDGGFVTQAEFGLRTAESWLAEKEFRIAELYLLRDQDRGARVHLSNIVRVFPDTDAAPRAREIMDEHGWDDSIHAEATLLPRGGLIGDPFDSGWAGLSGSSPTAGPFR